MGGPGTDEVELVQVVWRKSLNPRFRAISVQAIGLIWRRLQGLARGGSVTKYVTNVGKGQLEGISVALESLAFRTIDFLGKLWLKVHAAQKIGEARVRTDIVQSGVNINVHNSRPACKCLVQRCECSILLAEHRVISSRAGG